MLEWFEAKNFRSHKYSKLEFSPGINIIIGDPGSGKTNLMRGMILLFNNRPVGFRYHSNFTKDPDTVVTAKFTDPGVIVSLSKIESKATYAVGDQLFSGFKMSVPEPVQQAVNMSDINIQKQLEKPFLITDTAGEAAKTFNKITRMENVDIWTSQLTSKINTENKEIKLLDDQKKELESQVDQYNFIENMEIALTELEQMQLSINKKEEDLYQITAIIKEVRVLEKELEALKGIRETEKLVMEARQSLFKIEKVFDELDILDLIAVTQEEIDKLNKVVKTEKLLLESTAILNDLKTTSETIKTVNDIVSSIEKENGILSTNLKIAVDIKQDIKCWLEQDLKNKCPFCLSKMSDKSLNTIMEIL